MPVGAHDGATTKQSVTVTQDLKFCLKHAGAAHQTPSMLLLLNKDAFPPPGDLASDPAAQMRADALAQEVRHAKRVGMQLLLIHQEYEPPILRVAEPDEDSPASPGFCKPVELAAALVSEAGKGVATLVQEVGLATTSVVSEVCRRPTADRPAADCGCGVLIPTRWLPKPDG